MNVNDTMLAINVQLLKSAQLQEELPLTLIKASMENLQEQVVAEITGNTQQVTSGENSGEPGSTIDIKV